MRLPHRSKRFIDSSVQGHLVMRVLAYWALCLGGMFVLLTLVPLVVSWFFPGPGAPTVGQLVLQTWRVFWPPFFAAALILPFLVADVVRVSHRFVGPVHRLRGALRDLADGKSTPNIEFREGDFWCEMATEFNRVADRVRQADQSTAPPAKSADESSETLAC